MVYQHIAFQLCCEKTSQIIWREKDNQMWLCDIKVQESTHFQKYNNFQKKTAMSKFLSINFLMEHLLLLKGLTLSIFLLKQIRLFGKFIFTYNPTFQDVFKPSQSWHYLDAQHISIL